jgi:hypothetical protein
MIQNQVFKFCDNRKSLGVPGDKNFRPRTTPMAKTGLGGKRGIRNRLLGLCLLSADTTPSCLEPRRVSGALMTRLRCMRRHLKNVGQRPRVPLLLPPPALRECCYRGFARRGVAVCRNAIFVMPGRASSLHCRRIGREFAELIRRVGAHRRRARIARARDGARELYHRLASRHL